MFETAETRWQPTAARLFKTANAAPPAVSLLPAVLNMGRREPFIPPKGHLKTKHQVLVRLNHGVWQCRCPFCPSAQHAAEDGVFYCAHCLNVSCGHKTVAAVWPADREAIEAAISVRPDRANWNWEPHETIDDLLRENEEHGL